MSSEVVAHGDVSLAGVGDVDLEPVRDAKPIADRGTDWPLVLIVLVPVVTYAGLAYGAYALASSLI